MSYENKKKLKNKDINRNFKENGNAVYTMVVLNGHFEFNMDGVEYKVESKYDITTDSSRIYVIATVNETSNIYIKSFEYKYDVDKHGATFVKEYLAAIKEIDDTIKVVKENNIYKQKMLALKQMYQDEYEQACEDSAEDPCCEEYLFRQITYKEFITEIDKLLEEK